MLFVFSNLKSSNRSIHFDWAWLTLIWFTLFIQEWTRVSKSYKDRVLTTLMNSKSLNYIFFFFASLFHSKGACYFVMHKPLRLSSRNISGFFLPPSNIMRWKLPDKNVLKNGFLWELCLHWGCWRQKTLISTLLTARLYSDAQIVKKYTAGGNWFPLLFTDGDTNQKDFCRWPVSTKHTRRREKLFWTIRKGKYT